MQTHYDILQKACEYINKLETQNKDLLHGNRDNTQGFYIF